ncbi:MAG: redoxin family protein [bacterium]|nr:redoxin family protein [bacterium]
MKYRLTIILFVLIVITHSFLFPVSGQKGKRRSVKAPEFPASFQWLNTTEKLSLEKLGGHVILLTFWTYSNINSMHVIPDLEHLMQKYKSKPFYVVGVHSGKYYNEQDAGNVLSAIHRLGITYPVIVDAKHAIWKRYGIRAWPTYMLIGSGGNVLGVVTGEKRRKPLEKMINDALKKGKKSKTLAKLKLNLQPPAMEKKQLFFPTKIAMDVENKRLYIADSGHHQIVEAELQSPTTAKVLNRIGSGESGLKNGNYSQAAFSNPQGIDVHNGFLYVADTGNHAIRAVDLKNRKVRKMAGNGNYGEFGQPNSPWDLVYYNDTLYIAMAGNHQLWTIGIDDKEMELFVGNGYVNFVDGSALGSSLAQPSGITVDKEGKMLYFLDSSASALRSSSLENGAVKSLIGKGLYKYGFGDGTFDKASLQNPLGVCFHDNKIYLADSFNNALRVVDLKSAELLTVIRRNGQSKTTCVVNETEHKIPPLNEPNDVLVHNNYVYIADTNNHMIRVYDTAAKTLETLKLEE